MITGVRIDNGTMILLDHNGNPNNRINGSYVAAGVAGDHLISVNKYGHVEDWRINNSTSSGRLEDMRSLDNGATGAVTIQVSGPGTCIVACENGKQHVYSNYDKTRTISGPGPKSSRPSSNSSNEKEDFVPTSSSDSYNHQIPDGFLAGLGHRCKTLVNEPITGDRAELWTKLAFAIGFLAGLATAIISFIAADNSGSWERLLIAFGIIVVNTGISYWLRNMYAKALVRTHYGYFRDFIVRIISGNRSMGFNCRIDSLVLAMVAGCYNYSLRCWGNFYCTWKISS